MLRREVRRTRRYGIWIALAIATHATVIALLLPRGRAQVAVVPITIAPELTIAPAPFAAPPPAIVTDGRPQCPPARRDVPATVAPKLPEDVDAVAPSPTDAGWIVAWNQEHVFASHDGGRTFVRVLDAAGEVLGAQFDCWGHVVVVRGHSALGELGVREGDHERWHTIAPAPNGFRTATVLGGGPDVVVAGTVGNETILASSRDLGATWTARSLGPAFDKLHGRQDRDASVTLAFDTRDLSELVWHTIRGEDDDVVRVPGAHAAFAVFGDRLVTTSGWRRRGALEHPFVLPADRAVSDVIPGPVPLVTSGEDVYGLEGDALVSLHRELECYGSVSDPAGRIWSVGCGELRLAHKPGERRGCCDGD
jgi:hypothetical protein